MPRSGSWRAATRTRSRSLASASVLRSSPARSGCRSSRGPSTAITAAGRPVAADKVGGIPLTIDAVFAALLALGPEATLTGTWDADLGYPTDIAVDPIPNAVDDEFSIRIEDYSPAG